MRSAGLVLLGLALVTAAAVTGCTSDADEDTAGPIVIDAPWVRVAPEGQNSAAYMGITNKSDAEDRLVSASADVAPTVQIHETVMEGDVARMQELPDGVALPVDETVTLEPGGMHIMMTGLEKELVAGDTVSLTLVFEKAGEMVVDAPVKQAEGGSM